MFSFNVLTFLVCGLEPPLEEKILAHDSHGPGYRSDLLNEKRAGAPN
jgi:hypothetical protein